MRYFIGGDLGGTKTHMLIVDETGQARGFGESGSGNHQSIGFDGMYRSMREALDQALQTAGVTIKEIAGSGLGIGGYDWPSEDEIMSSTIRRLGMQTPIKFVNDAVNGLVAGAEDGWGVAVVSGTGCNCRGWDRDHRREGRVTGYGVTMGEGAGGTELMHRCMQLIGYAWTKRGPATALTDLMIQYTGARDLEDLLEGYTEARYVVRSDAAPLVFEVAERGDAVARELIHWAGCELGEMANAVIHQLDFEELAFDVVLTGGMFKGGPLLIDPMRETIHRVAPKARLVRLTVPPVLGGALIGLEAGGVRVTPEIRKTINASIASVQGLTVKPA
ncbi:MAG TPA: BadF/BadG/BcrA/BcrD ATPase family protein [Anaerolineales bacterium]|jgi:N-acetylglucosamine kinase-like BadF-type ATPase